MKPIELNEVVALAYNAGIGATLARQRLKEHLYGKRLTIEELFAPQKNPLQHKTFTYKEDKGTIIELAYRHDCNIDTMRTLIKNEFSEYEEEYDLKEELRKLGPRKRLDDLSSGGTWERKNLSPTAFCRTGYDNTSILHL